MPKSGIKIVAETPGTGPELKKGDRVRIRYDIQLNRGDYLARDQETILTFGDREFIAGFRYGLEGMRAGGTRRFRASPHLCYRDEELARIPKNAVLIFDVKQVEVMISPFATLDPGNQPEENRGRDPNDGSTGPNEPLQM
jgi:FKBP-type peptidyl-prolyl cis-trans isomerase